MTTHVATVHWQDDRWIDVQLSYLERHLPQPFKVYAFLNRLETDRSDSFFYSSDEDIKEHSTKLNLLSDLIAFNAADDDPLLFIDGDAFPIADLGRLIEEVLPRRKLIAVKREEASDVQPHPCFCLTTVGFWRELEGDWRKGGHHWVNAVGRKVSDVGARVLKAVDEQDVDWKPLLRSNGQNPHPLFFGVYDDLVYHHGAGFREARGGRMVIAESGAYEAERTLRYKAINALPRNKHTRKIRRRFDPVRKISRELKQQNAAMSAEWWDKIQADPDFYRELTEGAPGRLPSPTRDVAGSTTWPPPKVVFATGGSGTRAIAEVMAEAGVYLGPELNRALDSLVLKPILKGRSQEYIAQSKWVEAVERDPESAPDPPAELVSEMRIALERMHDGIPSGDGMWGWKNPRTTNLLPVLHSLEPDAPTAHLIRDGRDMAYSKNQNQLGDCPTLVPEELRGQPIPVQSIALWSRVNLAAIAFLEARKPDGHLVIRYEDLCADPKTHCERLLLHLGIPVSDRVLAKAEESVKLSSSAGRWRDADPAELKAVESAGEPALSRFGYIDR